MQNPREMESRFDELKRYVRLDAEDTRLLVALHPVAAPHFERIVRDFYERIREHEEAHAVFTGEDQIERLQRSLVKWLGRLLSGAYDDAYYEETAKIGRVHVRVGLPQRYLFTAMALIRVALEEIAERTLGDDAARTRSAVSRILDLELAIMVDSYRENREEQARRREELEARSLRSDLARTAHLYETAVDVSPSLVLGLDLAGCVRLFNHEAERVTGHPREDVIGTSFVDMLVPEDLRDTERLLLDALLAGPAKQESRESIVKTRAGKLREIRWHLSRIDPPKSAAGIASSSSDEIVLFAVGTDITEVNAASTKARRHEKLAAVGTLAAGLAHEIRNPLNGALLHVSFLQRALKTKKENTVAAADPDMTEAADVVADEIKRLARLVTEFLDFARPSVLAKKRVVVQALLARVVELTSHDAEAAAVTVSIDAPPHELVLSADPGKLEQVLLNVVQNAVEAIASRSSRTRGNVIVRARRLPRDVVLEIEDDGPGLPSADAPVFDAFFSTKPAGTGLGLAITHRIITDHGGTVDVESRPGRTCFRFSLPIDTDDHEKAEP